MHKAQSTLGCLLAAAILPSTGYAKSSQKDLVISGIQIVDTQTATVSAPSNVLIRNGKILKITPAGRGTGKAKTIDGRNKFMIAGLWDLHVHLESFTTPGAKPLSPSSWYAPLAMSYGVLGLRDLGSRTDPIIKLRAKFDQDRLAQRPAPILKVVGASFMGPQPWGSFDHIVIPKTPEDAKLQVQDHVAKGVDFIKVHDFLELPVYDAITAEAARLGKSVVGHLRPYSGPRESIAKGQRDFDHMPPELFAYCTGDGKKRTDAFYAGWYTGGNGYYERAITALYDEQGCQALFAEIGKQRGSVTPTLSVRFKPSGRSFALSSAYLPQAQMAACQKHDEAMRAAPASDLEAYRQMISKAIMSLHRANVDLLTGTDGSPESCAVPGLILLDEMDALVDAGLSRGYVLDAATRRSAQKAGAKDSGKVAKGFSADLVILNDNPLQDFKTLESPHGLVVAGQFLDQARIDNLKKSAADAIR